MNHFCRGLSEAGHTFEIGDLYAMGFQPMMDERQYGREVGLNPNAPVPDDVQNEQEKVDHADGLAFIFPLWWSDMPARMKGWFDRVWTFGYAYLYDDAEVRHTRICIQEAVVITSAGHSASHLEETGVADAMRKIVIQDRLLGVGVQRAHLEILGGMMPGVLTFRDLNLNRAHRLGIEFGAGRNK